MGWLGRKTSVGTLKSDIKEASGLPLDQRKQLASEMEEFIEEMRSVMQTPDHPSELMRLFQLHGANRKAQVPGGFSALWAHHAFRESYLLALIKAPDDPQWFDEVHTLLHGIRGPLGLVGIESPPQKSDPGGRKSASMMSDSAPDQSQSSVLSCSECGHENPAEVNFCTKCRAKMILQCNKCGFKSPQGSEFCGSCGEETEFRVEKMARNAALAAAAKAAAAKAAAAKAAAEAAAAKTAAAAEAKAVEIYFDNGQLEMRGYQKDDKWHGPYETYHVNGQLRFKGTCVAGELDGPSERYFWNGQLEGKGTYNMGVKCGEWIEDKPRFLKGWDAVTVTHPPCPPDPEDAN